MVGPMEELVEDLELDRVSREANPIHKVRLDSQVQVEVAHRPEKHQEEKGQNVREDRPPQDRAGRPTER
jgi:hypothetical protein